MLKGKKLLLRPFEEKDIHKQHEFNQLLENHILNGNMPYVSPIERAEEFFESCMQKDEKTDCFAIEVEGKYIGHASLNHHLPNAPLVYTITLTIGNAEYRSVEYYCEVIRLLRDYCFRYFGARRLCSKVWETNVQLKRSLISCGFVEECCLREYGWMDGEYRDLFTFGMLRMEWEVLEECSC